jgi:hypothetical protein
MFGMFIYPLRRILQSANEWLICIISGLAENETEVSGNKETKKCKINK